MGLREVMELAQIHGAGEGQNQYQAPGSLSAICRAKLPKKVWGSIPLFSVPNVLSSGER